MGGLDVASVESWKMAVVEDQTYGSLLSAASWEAAVGMFACSVRQETDEVRMS